ncbi:MAG: hypothetical protein ACOCX4_07170 [Planctomycetota bacterium]
MEKHIVFGVHVSGRTRHAPQVQELFTEYGCHIKTRLGLHHVDNAACSDRGLILLELFGEEEKCFELKDKLNALDGVEVQAMVFAHPE